MPRIPEEEIDRIKSATDLLALVRSRGVDLKKHGSRDFRGRCPFHDDGTTPNLIVSPIKGLYHCMACGAAGNAIQFVERFDGVSFRHAVELLAEGNGAAYEPRNKSGRVTKHATGRKLPPAVALDADDQALLNQVADYYHERLAHSPKALAYLERRGLDDNELVKRFRIGFADRTLGLRLPTRDGREGIAIRDRLQKIGIYRKSGHEHLNGSIVVPIVDAAGNVTKMYGRKVTPNLRKGSDDHLYLPGPHRGIFNAQALKSREIILCESILDALTFIRHGMEAATCIYGTEGFTAELFDAI